MQKFQRALAKLLQLTDNVVDVSYVNSIVRSILKGLAPSHFCNKILLQNKFLPTLSS